MSLKCSKKRSRSGPRAQRQPGRAKGSTKSSRERPQTAQASQRQPRAWHQHAKETTKTPKGRQTRPKRPPKRHQKWWKNVKKRPRRKLDFLAFPKITKKRKSLDRVLQNWAPMQVKLLFSRCPQKTQKTIKNRKPRKLSSHAGKTAFWEIQKTPTFLKKRVLPARQLSFGSKL